MKQMETKFSKTSTFAFRTEKEDQPRSQGLSNEVETGLSLGGLIIFERFSRKITVPFDFQPKFLGFLVKS